MAASWGLFLGGFKISNGEALCYHLIFLAEDGLGSPIMQSVLLGRPAIGAGVMVVLPLLF